MERSLALESHSSQGSVAQTEVREKSGDTRPLGGSPSNLPTVRTESYLRQN